MDNPTQRYFIEIAYDGTPYCGWQVQQNGLSVQAVLDSALHKLFRQPIATVGCGRTDAGVHAAQYYVHFDAPTIADNTEFLFKINRILDKNIAVKRLIADVPPNAHARFDAVYRAYNYYIHFEKNPFCDAHSYYYAWLPLDIAAMQQAAAMLMQYNDFPMFCKTGGGAKTTLCQIFDSTLHYHPAAQTLVLHIAANRFLRGMIRLIVGALLMVGKGKISLDEWEQTLNNHQFRFAKLNISAPPQGLFLAEVRYPYL
ncbi:MAG: tRNA pseudouridine(38-40) synthase TruA [Chitinophagales bacterium]|nr:tRNA pseudouridine(38-40) synthase TruA [Chitinophagales bacterium]